LFISGIAKHMAEVIPMNSVTHESRQIVAEFWAAMQTNDFRAAAALLADSYVLEWPQSGEHIRGRSNFIAVNEHYPATGAWQFTVHRLIADGSEVASEVSVTDGVTAGRAITFSSVRDGKIVQQVEYWPDPFEAAAWRAPWVERV
jgi:limonene-1,2-epoxide hydrolase